MQKASESARKTPKAEQLPSFACTSPAGNTMPTKDHMLKRHEDHVERLEYELGLFASSTFFTDPPELKEDLAEHVRQALAGEREIVDRLRRLRNTSSSIGRQDEDKSIE